MIPDLVSDHCTDAAKRLNLSVAQVLFKAAESCRGGHGFSNNPEVGDRWYNIWKRSGYWALPPACQEFILGVLNGEIASPITKVI